MKRAKRNKILAVSAVAALAVITGAVSWKKSSSVTVVGQNTQASREPSAIDQVRMENLHRGDSAVVSSLKQKNYDAYKLIIEKARPDELPDFLGQTVYFMDTQTGAVEGYYRLVEIVLNQLNASEKIFPRSVVLAGKIIAKSQLSKKEKMDVEKQFKNFRKQYPAAWVEATVSWTPMPGSTLQLMKSWKKSKLNNETRDFAYFLPRVEDEKAKSKLR